MSSAQPGRSGLDVSGNPATLQPSASTSRSSQSALSQVFNQPGVGFVLLPPGKKAPPIDTEWQKKPHTFDEAVRHVAAGGNVGIIAGNGYGELDMDDLSAFEGLKLPETTTWETRPGRAACWFRWQDDVSATLRKLGKPEDIAKILLEKDGKAVGEIKLQRSYQVIPPSWKEVDGERVDYRITSDTPPAEIGLEDLIECLHRAGVVPVGVARSPPARPLPGGAPEQHNIMCGETVFDRQMQGKKACELLEQTVARVAGKVGERNQAGFELLCRLRDLGLSMEEAAAYGKKYVDRIEAARLPGQHPYTENEMTNSLKQAYTREPREPALMVKLDGVDIGERIEDRENAKIAADLLKNVVKYSPGRGWMLYEHGRWQPVSAAVIKNLTTDTLYMYFVNLLLKMPFPDKKELSELTRAINRCRTHTRVAACLEFLQGLPGILVKDEKWDAVPHLLNLDNGTLDLKTMEFRAHDPEDLITHLAPVKYDPGADCPKWKAHLEYFIPHPEIRRQIQRDVGLALLGGSHSEALPIWYGTGANGKTTTARVIQKMLGTYAKAAAPHLLIETRHERHPTEVADLAGSRIVFCSEIPAGGRLNEERVKQLTGGDTLKGRFMRMDFFEFERTFTLFLIANHKPIVRGTEYAIWRRIRLIPWTVTIPPEKQKPADDVVAELLTEASGILNWALEGLKDWRQDPHWLARGVSEATEEYRGEEDILGPFLMECCELHPRYAVRFSELYNAYTDWCQRHEEMKLSRKTFHRRLEERGVSFRKSDGNVICTGIRLGRMGQSGRTYDDDNRDGGQESDDQGRLSVYSLEFRGNNEKYGESSLIVTPPLRKGSPTCATCGASAAEPDMIQRGDHWICAACAKKERAERESAERVHTLQACGEEQRGEERNEEQHIEAGGGEEAAICPAAAGVVDRFLKASENVPLVMACREKRDQGEEFTSKWLANRARCTLGEALQFLMKARGLGLATDRSGGTSMADWDVFWTWKEDTDTAEPRPDGGKGGGPKRVRKTEKARA